jgi:hypothetical protein
VSDNPNRNSRHRDALFRRVPNADQYGIVPLDMFDEPDEPGEQPTERATDPAKRAKEKSDELSMYAVLAAVFEGVRKLDARLLPGLDAAVARDVQRAVAKLEKSQSSDSPVIPEASTADAAALLAMPANAAADLSTNDYHIHRRPGETMLVRWLADDEVETFYTRLQAHFDAGLEGFKEDERQAHAWKQDPDSTAFLDAIDRIEVVMADRWLRNPIRKLGLFVLSTQTADEINLAYLTDHVMGVAPADLVGRPSAPPDDPSEQDLAWFYKLYCLRGVADGVERMCFFAYLQKSDDLF